MLLWLLLLLIVNDGVVKGVYIIKISHLFHKKKVKTCKKPYNELYLDMSAFIFVPSFY